MLGNVIRWRGCLPRRADRNCRREAQNNRRKRLEHPECHRGCEDDRGRAEFLSLRLRAAIVGCGLGELRAGRRILTMMQRTRAVLAALSTRFGRGLPASTLRRGALHEREHAGDRDHASQERPHTFRMRRSCQRVK